MIHSRLPVATLPLEEDEDFEIWIREKEAEFRRKEDAEADDFNDWARNRVAPPAEAETPIEAETKYEAEITVEAEGPIKAETKPKAEITDETETREDA